MYRYRRVCVRVIVGASLLFVDICFVLIFKKSCPMFARGGRSAQVLIAQSFLANHIFCAPSENDQIQLAGLSWFYFCRRQKKLRTFSGTTLFFSLILCTVACFAAESADPEYREKKEGAGTAPIQDLASPSRQLSLRPSPPAAGRDTAGIARGFRQILYREKFFREFWIGIKVCLNL